MARAPEAIQRLWTDIDKAIPKAKLGGIVGDVKHSFGYHLARSQVGNNDYSRQLARDLRGKSDCASALDITLPADLMKICTKRLLTAAKANDSRLRAVREFCGTLDGRNTYPWDLSTNTSEGIGTWDDSHLWHIHISFYREFADDYDALAPVADVLAGKAKEEPLSAAEVKQIIDAIEAEGHKTRVKLNDLFTVSRAGKNGEVRTLANQLYHTSGDPKIPYTDPRTPTEPAKKTAGGKG